MAYLLLFFSLCVGYYLFQWIQNYNIARKIGFPIYLTPLSPQNIAWLFIGASYQPQLEKYLPKWAYDRIIPSVQGWEHNQKWNVNARLGPVYTLVAPTLNEVWIADPAMAKEVLTRRKDFIQLPMSQLILNRFGPSLPGSNGEVWQHQRRIIAPILNERIMESVWNDGRRLAVKEVGKLEHLVEAMRSVTINILGSTVYGSRVSYQGAEKPPKGYSQTFMTSVINLVSNLILCGVAPVWALKLPIWPKWVKEIGVAAEEFPRHAMTMVEDVRSETERPNSLVGALVKAADADKQNFKEEDIMGNMFTFTLAGYDTTASAFTYAFLILALEPKWQDWIIEEIDHVRAETEGDYASTYPQLQRCLALMVSQDPCSRWNITH